MVPSFGYMLESPDTEKYSLHRLDLVGLGHMLGLDFFFLTSLYFKSAELFIQFKFYTGIQVTKQLSGLLQPLF